MVMEEDRIGVGASAASSAACALSSSLSLFFFFLPHGMWDPSCPHWGSKTYPLHWKHRVPTTGPPGKPLHVFSYLIVTDDEMGVILTSTLCRGN